MPDFTVHQYGVDAYGRPVYMTVFMHEWFENYVDLLGWRPRILQGAWMERLGGGAAASDGAHDKAMCLDLETLGRTYTEISRMVRIAREQGAGAYRRDRTWRHGSMVPHMHLTLGADEVGSPMAEILWLSYVSGGDGLGIQPPQPDYEWRPEPLVIYPPEEDVSPEQEDRIVAKVTEAVLKTLPDAIWDKETVGKDDNVATMRQAVNQIRNTVKKNP
jgi:hypothetical protein